MLTILTLKILLMIVYLSHWDWNLYKSRKDIVSTLSEINFRAVCPEGSYSNDLKNIYHEYINFLVTYIKLPPTRQGKKYQAYGEECLFHTQNPTTKSMTCEYILKNLLVMERALICYNNYYEHPN